MRWFKVHWNLANCIFHFFSHSTNIISACILPWIDDGLKGSHHFPKQLHVIASDANNLLWIMDLDRLIEERKQMSEKMKSFFFLWVECFVCVAVEIKLLRWKLVCQWGVDRRDVALSHSSTRSIFACGEFRWGSERERERERDAGAQWHVLSRFCVEWEKCVCWEQMWVVLAQQQYRLYSKSNSCISPNTSQPMRDGGKLHQ